MGPLRPIFFAISVVFTEKLPNKTPPWLLPGQTAIFWLKTVKKLLTL